MKNENLVPYEGKKGKTSGSGTKLCKPLETDDLTAVLDLTLTVSKARSGRPAEYPNTQQGLEAFISNTISYFEYLNEVNKNPDIEKKIVPDLENWAVFMGVTRQTIWAYESRGMEWKRTIDYYKTCIQAAKKQLALTYRIPPAVFIFDSVNNHNYLNVTEYKLTQQDKPETEENKTDTDERIRAAGLVWDEELKVLVPMEGLKNE